jgi:CheY-like chemotaxis protein
MDQKPCLLIADDDPTIREMLSAALESDAWRIETADDALQALIKIRSLQPFLVLTDVKMPKYGKGTDLLRSVRMEKAIAATPFIILTGMDLNQVRKMIPEDDKGVRLIGKPPDFLKILELIKELTGVDAAGPSGSAVGKPPLA